VRLTTAEYKLLVLLTETPGAVVTRDEMARYLWQSPHAGNGHTCQAHISNLRKKIPSRIVTIRGEGYRYAA
jgi:two-component system alkaline phosphatase synthesis response regulator PhoP